jgi:multidrug efflux pump subunit AcrA (membrane-fusion protein)
VWTIVAVTLLICALLGAWFILENQTFDVETVVVQSAEFSVVVTGSGNVQAFEPVDV